MVKVRNPITADSSYIRVASMLVEVFYQLSPRNIQSWLNRCSETEVDGT
jgi:hypothetical protein